MKYVVYSIYGLAVVVAILATFNLFGDNYDILYRALNAGISFEILLSIILWFMVVVDYFKNKESLKSRPFILPIIFIFSSLGAIYYYHSVVSNRKHN